MPQVVCDLAERRLVSNARPSVDSSGQAEVIAFLADPATHDGATTVERFETHGNLVFLAGSEAWKIKRAVRFPYMDFSTLEKRGEACAHEAEINGRLAPGLYLGCVPITRTRDGGLAFRGDGAVVEWAVHMRRFEQSALLASIATREGISPELARAVADTVLDSHRRAQPARGAAGAAQVGMLVTSLADAFARLKVFEAADVVQFQRETERQLRRASGILDERARSGLVRRCHGDLHLGNIVLWQGRPVLFDAIEFDEAIATIDTLYDLAFLLMDLDWHRQREAANVVLNRYLWRCGDDLAFEGLAALPLLLACRAGVRAMVTAERAGQEQPAAAHRDQDKARAYLRTALAYLVPPPPRLIVVGGLSGTGKSTLAAALAPALGAAPGAVHLRSDLERKSLFGVGDTDPLPAHSYTREMRARIYAALRAKARSALAAGHCIVADAVYAAPQDRAAVEALATELGVPFQGLWMTAPPETMTARVASRRDDASDATPEVVRRQLAEDIGVLSPAWSSLDSSASPDEVLRRARIALAAGG
jgi:aminoglycoside phosphotransferase family enzyme/predicted kinase